MSIFQTLHELMEKKEERMGEVDTVELKVAEKAVARGAALLDRKMPNWFRRINLAGLEMESGESCILGYAFRSEIAKGFEDEVDEFGDAFDEDGYLAGVRTLFGKGDAGHEKAGQHGFNDFVTGTGAHVVYIEVPSVMAGFTTAVPVYDVLQALWTGEVKARRAAARKRKAA